MARITRMDERDEQIGFVSLVQFVVEKHFGCGRRPRWVLRGSGYAAEWAAEPQSLKSARV